MPQQRQIAPRDISIGEGRKDLGNIEALAHSIEDLTLLQPIGVTGDNHLIYGERRLTAWIKNYGEDAPIPCIVHTTVTDAVIQLQMQRDENTQRKAMTKVELYDLGKRIEAIEVPEAIERMRTSKEGGIRVRPDGLTQPTAVIVAEGLDLSDRQWRRLKRLGDAAAKGDATAVKLLDKVETGKLTLTGADEAYTGTQRVRDRTDERRPSIDVKVRKGTGKRIRSRYFTEWMDVAQHIESILETPELCAEHLEGLTETEFDRLTEEMKFIQRQFTRYINMLKREQR